MERLPSTLLSAKSIKVGQFSVSSGCLERKMWQKQKNESTIIIPQTVEKALFCLPRVFNR
eukprot:scaffold1174_cov234-Ochromonas_danica.AAC.3